MLKNVTRDPSNPVGYLRHFCRTAPPVAMSYLIEGLDCYVAGLHKAAAVMVGGAAESLILDLRDLLIRKLTTLRKSIPKGMEDWKIRTVSEALQHFFQVHAPKFKRQLREPFEVYWSGFAQQIRATRNEAGHPASVDAVSPDTVRAALLIFPELARLAGSLTRWTTEDFGGQLPNGFGRAPLRQMRTKMFAFYVAVKRYLRTSFALPNSPSIVRRSLEASLLFARNSSYSSRPGAFRSLK